MLLRREVPADREDIRKVHASAFAAMTAGDGEPVEGGLVDSLRASDGWIPELSIVAIGAGGDIVGHVVCHRGRVSADPALGLGPLGVLPELHGQGVGSALMHAVLGAADAMREPLVALLGHPDYYPRFGFRLAETYDITPPVAAWRPHFQVRTLAAYEPSIRGEFSYAEPFTRL